MTNPSSDFERWGESLGEDLEAHIRELAALPGYVVLYAKEAVESIGTGEKTYADKVELFDFSDGEKTITYRVGYMRDMTDETG